MSKYVRITSYGNIIEKLPKSDKYISPIINIYRDLVSKGSDVILKKRGEQYVVLRRLSEFEKDLEK